MGQYITPYNSVGSRGPFGGPATPLYVHVKAGRACVGPGPVSGALRGILEGPGQGYEGAW